MERGRRRGQFERIKPGELKLPVPRGGMSFADSRKRLLKDVLESARLSHLRADEVHRLRVCCPYCHGDARFCDMCGSAGVVCPTCTGARWLARRRSGQASELVRCGDCGLAMVEGWIYDVDKEFLAVEAWLFEYRRELEAREARAAS
jgi:hypothetical protein